MLKTGGCLNRRKYPVMSLKTKLTINYSVSASLLLWSFYFFALKMSVVFFKNDSFNENEKNEKLCAKYLCT